MLSLSSRDLPGDCSVVLDVERTTPSGDGSRDDRQDGRHVGRVVAEAQQSLVSDSSVQSLLASRLSSALRLSGMLSSGGEVDGSPRRSLSPLSGVSPQISASSNIRGGVP